MPEARDPHQIHLLVGGRGAVRFGIDLDAVGRILEHDELPERFRSVNVPRLFGLAVLEAEADRYAQVPTAGPEAHLRVGPDTAVEEMSRSRVAPLPHVLGRAAARWGWHGVCVEDDRVVVVVDAARLSTIGAPDTREVSP